MSFVIFESIGVILYTALFIYSWQKLSEGKELHSYINIIVLIAIGCHGYIAYMHIDGGEGQNLGLFNIFCMTTWLAMCMVGWNLIRHQAHSLLLVTLPIAAISIIEVSLFPSGVPISLGGRTINLFHIFSGIAAMSILLLAALQSLLVLYLDRGLKRHPATIYYWLGPLQGMERYLIQLLTIGFILMSISLAFVFLIPEDLTSGQALHKVLLTVASWLILAILMFGRYVKGWRGVFAAKWSLLGVFLLLLGYFGSKLALEFILN